MGYFNLLSRFSAMYELLPQSLGPALLQPLMDARGLGHKLAVVRSNACRNLHTTIKRLSVQTRAHMKPFVEQAVTGLNAIIQPAFDVVRTTPWSDLV